MLYTADSGKVMQSADSRPANYATIKALHLLSGAVPIDDSFRYLGHAQQAIERASRAGDYEKVDIELLQSLREQTAELWSLYEKERAGELSHAWPEPVRDQASGLFIRSNEPRREQTSLLGSGGELCFPFTQTHRGVRIVMSVAGKEPVWRLDGILASYNSEYQHLRTAKSDTIGHEGVPSAARCQGRMLEKGMQAQLSFVLSTYAQFQQTILT
ncbi:hypothetical protein LTR17_010821 [Elasticomyces elasticus]|nr:hypothetical protein LTR17_010821 [Elasticomyces elasticus]